MICFQAAGKYAGNKRESISTFGNEYVFNRVNGWIYLILNNVYHRRRVSFKASKEASVDKGKGK